MTVALVPVAAVPASAAIVVTPEKSSGSVHVSDNWLDQPEAEWIWTVDIEVCASFSEPVVFVEADVSTDVTAVSMDAGGSGLTSVCFPFHELQAGGPGTHPITVAWTAHNGNGLSQAGALDLSGSYDVPLPKEQKFTEEQRQDLHDASLAMVGAGIICLVAGIALAPISLGALAIGFFGGLAAGAIAADLSQLANDPPDPDYKVPVVAHNLSLPPIVAGNGISTVAADALNALRTVQEDETGQAGAMVEALFKASGAAAANDTAWEQTQTLAAAGFAHQLAIGLNSEPPLRSAARTALETGGFPVLGVTQAQAAAALASWQSPGLTQSEEDTLTFGGTLPDLEVRAHALASDEPMSSFVQQNFLDLLAPPSGAATNLIETANAKAAAALQAAADALTVHPVGSPPPPPGIISGVHPSIGVAAGGNAVTVEGSNLQDTQEIDFGTHAISGGSCSETQCVGFAPPGTGTVHVTAVGPGGSSATTDADLYTYVVAGLGTVPLPDATLVSSGGFDPPGAGVVGSFESIDATGEAALGPGWHITSGNVDLVGPSSAQAAEGLQFIDLDGNGAAGPGTIAQTLQTLPGHQYRLSFRLAGNPNGDPVIKTVRASLGTTTQDFSFDTTGHSNIDLGWVEDRVDALSCASTMPLILSSTTPGIRGPNIDAVSVVDLGLAPGTPCLDRLDLPPQPTDQTLSTKQDQALGITLSASDFENEALTYVIVTQPSHGTLSGTAPNLTYTPAPGYSGADTFTFKVNDGKQDSAFVGTVNIAVTSGNHPPTLHLDAASASAQYSDPIGPVGVSATDPDGADALTLTAAGLPASVVLTDNHDRTGSIGGIVNVGAASYGAMVSVSDGKASDSKPFAIAVTPETASASYNGDATVALATGQATAPVVLSTQLIQDDDGHPGDITKARVFFDLYSSSNTTMVSPDITLGPFAPGSTGIASTMTSLGADTWAVVVRFQSGNAFYTGPPSEAAIVTVYAPAPGKITGGGWVTDPSFGNLPVATSPTSPRGNFGFVIMSKPGSTSVQGNFLYVFRGIDCRNYVIRSSSWSGGSLSIAPDGKTASVTGNATVGLIDCLTGQKSELTGFTFRLDVVDNGSPGTTDRFALGVWRGQDLWHQSGTATSPLVLGGGNITIHKK
jgi:choice-of-anchor C domain-containing protein